MLFEMAEPPTIMDTLNKMRENEDMCDVTLTSSEGERLSAHSIVLAAASPVFKVMLTREFKEFHSREVKIPDAGKHMLAQIVKFVYTGQVEINENNLLEMFHLADRMELKNLLIFCKKYIMQEIDVNNCLGIRQLGERYHHADLVQIGTIYMLQNFQEFASTNDFLEITDAELEMLLLHDELNIENEIDLIRVLFRWLEHSPKTRMQYKQRLVRCLRYPLISLDSFKKFLDKPHLHLGKDVRKFMQEVYNTCHNMYFFNDEFDASILETSAYLNRKHRIPPQVIFLVGGWHRGRILDVVECYNIRANDWILSQHLCDPAGGRGYFGMEVLNDKVYFIGGYDGKTYLNSVRCFEPIRKCWSEVAPMHIKRCFTGTVVLNDELYAIAGFDGARRLATVEKFTPATNQWTRMGSIKMARSDAACCVHKGVVYVMGGYAGDSLTSSEVYDPQADEWRFIAPMNCKRSGAVAISLANENLIMVAGGYNGLERQKGIEFYNPDTNRWTHGPPMSTARSNFAACLVGKEVYVIGGYTGSDTIAQVEKFDFATMTWKFSSLLNYPRSAMKACLLRGLSNMKDYLSEVEVAPIQRLPDHAWADLQHRETQTLEPPRPQETQASLS